MQIRFGSCERCGSKKPCGNNYLTFFVAHKGCELTSWQSASLVSTWPEQRGKQITAQPHPSALLTPGLQSPHGEPSFFSIQPQNMHLLFIPFQHRYPLWKQSPGIPIHVHSSGCKRCFYKEAKIRFSFPTWPQHKKKNHFDFRNSTFKVNLT